MKIKLLGMLLLMGTGTAMAQIPEDALRYSWLTTNGSARNMAIGGAMGSLGGDITATYVNPAGLGFYKNFEFVFTPSFMLNNNSADFRGTDATSKKNSFGIGPTGIILGEVSRKNSKNSSAFSFAINQTAHFNNRVQFNGLNNHSSFSEMFVEEFAYSGLTIDEALNTMSAVPYGAAPALYTYLIDTTSASGTTIVKGAPEYILDAGGALNQSYTQQTKGGIYELAVAVATNKMDKWYFGGTIGIPIMIYDSKTSFTESDTSSNTANGFGSFTYDDNYRVTGAGFNLKFGVIYRPQDYLRFGLALHTPSFMFLNEERTSFLRTELENPAQTFDVSSTVFTNGQPGEVSYLQFTPWKAMISGSYVFREVENVERQKGFITADLEYVNYKGSRFKSDPETKDIEKPYYDQLNEVIKDEYKGAFNVRVGGELKFNTIMGRLGFAYYGNPYSDASQLKANRTLLSGGLGYRDKGFFIDLTYVHRISKDANFPYRLSDKANTYAELNQQRGNIIATVGWKF